MTCKQYILQWFNSPIIGDDDDFIVIQKTYWTWVVIFLKQNFYFKLIKFIFLNFSSPYGIKLPVAF